MFCIVHFFFNVFLLFNIFFEICKILTVLINFRGTSECFEYFGNLKLRDFYLLVVEILNLALSLPYGRRVVIVS